MNKAEAFFYEHAGYSYKPGEETPEQGRERGAKALAAAEHFASENGYSFNWLIDPEIDSSDYSDEDPAWELWGCIMRDEQGEVRQSLWAIDFGRDKEPWGEPYRRVVEAELALEEMPN